MTSHPFTVLYTHSECKDEIPSGFDMSSEKGRHFRLDQINTTLTITQSVTNLSLNITQILTISYGCMDPDGYLTSDTSNEWSIKFGV